MNEHTERVDAIADANGGLGNTLIPIFEAVRWPEGMQPSRCPIHFTNELQVPFSVEAIWSLIVDPKVWPLFYPGVQHVDLLSGGDLLEVGTEFETTLAGQDVFAAVQEFEPMTRIAWGGYPKVAKDSTAYHAWILTPTADGCHIWMEETMRGPHWIELAKKAPDAFWLAHERLLHDLAQVASERAGTRS